MNKTLAYLVLAVVVALVALGVWGALSKEKVTGPELGTAYDIQGQEHIAFGAEHPVYNSNPPSSGWHYAEPAVSGFYDIGEIVSDEQAIHNLEHGDVWIAYHPRISDANREELRTLAAPKVLITPREANEFDISLVAWGRVYSFNIEVTTGLDLSQAKEFIKRYLNKGPEKVPPGMNFKR